MDGYSPVCITQYSQYWTRFNSGGVGGGSAGIDGGGSGGSGVTACGGNYSSPHHLKPGISSTSPTTSPSSTSCGLPRQHKSITTIATLEGKWSSLCGYWSVCSNHRVVVSM